MTHTPSRTRSLRRRTTAASAALFLGLSLAACGGGDSDDEADDTPSPRASESTSQTATETPSETSEPVEPTETEAPSGDVPTEEALAAALLTAADVPAGLTEKPSTDDEEDDDSFPGTCLAEVGKFSDALGFDAASEAETEFAAEDAGGQTSINSKLQAYPDADALAPAFAAFGDRLEGCTEVSTTDDQGITYDLKISYDDTVDLPGAEEQLRIQIAGTLSSGDQSFDITFRIVGSVIGNVLSSVGVSTLGEADASVLDTIDDLAVTQAERVGQLS